MATATVSAPTRTTITVPISWRAETRQGEDRVIAGRAAVFGSTADLGSFTEEVAPGAFRRVLSRPDCDPVLLLNHDPAMILARRSAGTLVVEEDERGLAFAARVVPTSLGNDVLTLVRSGHLTQCSFAFTVAKDSWTQRGGKPHRVIEEVAELFDLTLTAAPAYRDTDVRNRRLGEVKAKARAERERIERDWSRGGRPRLKPADPYGPDSPHSWFRDSLVVALSERTLREAQDRGARYVSLPETTLSPRSERGDQGGIDAARERLRLAAERRDVGWQGLHGIAPANMPGYLAEAFGVAAHARASVAAILNPRPLPPGLRLRVPVLSTGVTMSVQATEAAAITASDVDTTPIDTPVATLVCRVSLSIQALERSEPGFDEVLAREIGAAWGEALDRQIISGSGASGETTGLLNTSGIVSVTYDSASPAVAELLARCWQADSQLAAGYGANASVAIAHGRRVAWVEAKLAGQPGPRLPGRQTVIANAMPTTLGASTNQDRIVLLADVSEVVLGIQSPSVRVLVETADDQKLVANVVAHGYVALAVRTPSSVAVIGGTGLAAPSF